MIKMQTMAEKDLAKDLVPEQVQQVIEDNLVILDESYGEDIAARNGYGGYVAVLTTNTDVDSFKGGNLDLSEVTTEYFEQIDGTDWVASLVLEGSDNGVVFVMPKGIAEYGGLK